MQLAYDLYANDGKLLVRKDVPITQAIIAKIRGMGNIRPCRRIPIKKTFIFKDFKCVFSDSKYNIIFNPPVTKRAICKCAGSVKMEEDLVRELAGMKKKLPYTYEHVLIVTALSIKIALSDPSLKYDRTIAAHCGFTHDIGKTRIPISILNKKGGLTRSERALVETHSAIGYLLLNYYLKCDRCDCAIANLEHHERSDGTGYPKGIRRIHRYTRLISVIDVFDALMAKRPYRKKPFSLRATIDYLVKQAREDKLDWDIVRMLIRYARKERPDICRMNISRALREPLPQELSHDKFS